MKNLFFMLLLATLSFFALSANAQTIPASEIMKIIDDNDWENFRNNGVVNPDLILPGQTVSYRFNFTVQPGESQYSIVRDRLSKLTAQNGEVVAPPQKESVRSSTPQKPLPMDPVKGNVEIPWDDADLPWWVWPIIVAIIALAVFGGIKSTRNNNKRYEDPVTAGPPQVSSGVGDRGARARVQQIAQDQFPSANIQVENVRRGRLSGPAMVHYAGVNPQQKVLDNIFAYAGEVTINGIRQTVYFLQGCGNDARRGNFMTGSELLFTPDAEIAEDGTASPITPAPAVTDAPPAQQAEEQKVAKVTEEGSSGNTSSEFHNRSMKALEVVDKFLSKKDLKHKVEIRIHENELEIIIENKFPSTPK